MARLIALVLLSALRLHAATQTDEPTDAPTDTPTSAPTDAPTGAPTDPPTGAPTGAPTAAPTDVSTDAPTDAPTGAPTDAPTDAPTGAPTGAPTLAAECSGIVFLNSTFEGECALKLHVDTSHCGFEVTPDYDVLDDHLQFYNCSHVVNPSPTGFEILCVYPAPPSLVPLSPSPSPSASPSPSPSPSASTDEPTEEPTGAPTVAPTEAPTASPSPSGRRLRDAADRRLSFFGDGNFPFPVYPEPSDDEDAVLTWTARRPAYVQECNATVANLSQRVEELEEELASCQTTVTTTQISQSRTSASLTGTIVTTATSTTVTQTTTIEASAIVVASAGAGGGCVSYLPFLIASLALNGLLILLLAFQHFRGKKVAAPDQQAASPPAAPVWEFNAEEAAGTPPSEVRSDHQAGAVSRGTNLSSSVPSGEEVGGVRSGGQQSSNTWAGRSIIYRYLRRGPRSGNEIQASSRRGWRMNAQEPPNMDDPQSAATSRAPSAAASRDTPAAAPSVPRTLATVKFARSRSGTPASGAARSSGARGSADPDPSALAEEEYQV